MDPYIQEEAYRIGIRPYLDRRELNVAYITEFHDIRIERVKLNTERAIAHFYGVFWATIWEIGHNWDAGFYTWEQYYLLRRIVCETTTLEIRTVKSEMENVVREINEDAEGEIRYQLLRAEGECLRVADVVYGPEEDIVNWHSLRLHETVPQGFPPSSAEGILPKRLVRARGPVPEDELDSLPSELSCRIYWDATLNSIPTLTNWVISRGHDRLWSDREKALFPSFLANMARRMEKGQPMQNREADHFLQHMLLIFNIHISYVGTGYLLYPTGTSRPLWNKADFSPEEQEYIEEWAPGMYWPVADNPVVDNPVVDKAVNCIEYGEDFGSPMPPADKKPLAKTRAKDYKDDGYDHDAFYKD